MFIKAYDDCEDDVMDVTSVVLQSRCSEYGDGWQGW